MVLIPLFLFFIYNNKIINFIEKYLIIDPPFLNFWLDLIIILISLILISRLIRNFIKYKYLASFLEVYIYSSICFLVTYFYVKKDDLQWTFLLDSIFKINYVFYFLGPLYLFLAFYVYKLFNRHFVKPFMEKSSDNNEFKNDDPLDEIANDKLGYLLL